MAYTSIIFENPNTGKTRKAPVGLSWTVFFFGFWVALFRRDWKWGAIMFTAELILAYAPVLYTGYAIGLGRFIFMFIYNKLYIKDLIASGFKAKSITNGDIDSVADKLGIQIPRLDSNMMHSLGQNDIPKDYNHSTDLAKNGDAHQKGGCTTNLKILKSLAEQGDAEAQSFLDKMQNK